MKTNNTKLSDKPIKTIGASENASKKYTKPVLNSYGLLRDITMAPTVRTPSESGFCGQAFCGIRI